MRETLRVNNATGQGHATAMSDSSAYQRALTEMIYGSPPSKEVLQSDAWDYCVVNGDYYYRGESGVKFLKNKVRIMSYEHEWIPDERAINELKDLMDSWRAAGLADFTREVEIHVDEDGEESSVYDLFGESKTKRITKTYLLSQVKFYKELPHGEPVKEPRTVGRLTGLSTAGLLNI